MGEVSIMIGGDLVPTGSNRELFAQGNLDQLIGKTLRKVLDRNDFLIFNLEVPFTDYETPILKHGPNFRAPTDTIHGIEAMKTSLVTLANNHIMDQDEQGLLSTIRLLTSHHINYVGAGRNKREASKPFLFEKEGIRVGIYACAEREFSIAEEDKMGANPFDPLESPDHISDLKRICDYVIVLYHGGKEQYRYPSPDLQKVCRKMAEKGADLVVCQHSHCIGCIEKYDKTTICYGQGNFLFDGSDHETWRTGLLLELLLKKGEISVRYLPLVKHNSAVRLADTKRRNEILSALKERSMHILLPNFIEEEYRKFAASKLDDYMAAMCGRNYLYRITKKIFKNKILKRYSKKQLLAIQNYIQCEAHRELILKGLKSRYGRRNTY